MKESRENIMDGNWRYTSGSEKSGRLFADLANLEKIVPGISKLLGKELSIGAEVVFATLVILKRTADEKVVDLSSEDHQHRERSMRIVIKMLEDLLPKDES